jgi:PAB-dependent poly(A)-specific ribonuclease subunit 3
MGRAAPAEEVLWGYLVQATSALRAAHAAGLLLRPSSLAPSKILLTSPGRIRVGARCAAPACAACWLSCAASLHCSDCCAR